MTDNNPDNPSPPSNPDYPNFRIWQADGRAEVALAELKPRSKPGPACEVVMILIPGDPGLMLAMTAAEAEQISTSLIEMAGKLRVMEAIKQN